MKRIILLLIPLVTLVSACSTTPDGDTYTYRDAMGNTTDLIVDNLLETKENEGDLLWLNASRIGEGREKPRYYLETRYETIPQKGWLHIPAGNSLVLRVNGQAMKLHTSGSLNTRSTTPSGTFLESAIYPVSAEQLLKISSAKTVEVELSGANRVVQRRFAPANTAKFMEFVGNRVNRDT